MVLRKGLFSVWQDLGRLLPVGTDTASRTARDKLFDELDTRGNSILFQTDFNRGMFRRMPVVQGIRDMQQVCNQSFVAARELIDPIAQIGGNQCDRNQFRGVLLYLQHFFKLWDHFLQIGAESGTLFAAKELAVAGPLVREWGVQGVESWEHNPDAVFRELDRCHQGAVNFNEFADFVLRQTLTQLTGSSAEEEEERKRAHQLVARVMPHVAERAPVRLRPGFNGCVPPVPPPGQKRPPRLVGGLSGSEQVAPVGTAGSRWATQYQCDYMKPVRSMPNTAPPQATIAVEPQPRTGSLSPCAWRMSRPGDVTAPVPIDGTPPNGGTTSPYPPARLPPAPHSHPSSGRGSKAELRSRLDTQLSMMSTNHMRNLLQVAGGMVMSPSSGRQA